MTKLVNMPVHIPEVRDFSIISTHQRCCRKWFYQYHLCRAPTGIDFSIQFGAAYHKFREVIEKIWIDDVKGEKSVLMEEAAKRHIFLLGYNAATENWRDPPTGHTKEYLTKVRFGSACDLAFDDWVNEKLSHRYKVLFTEQAFDLPLESGKRFGGRFDQIVEWNNRLWVRDFKTVSRMGKNYSRTFDPNNQMTGYVWAANQLSGRHIEGVIIDIVYNTKTKGPEFHSFLTTRSSVQIEWWKQTMLTELEEIERHISEDSFPMRTGACNDYSGCFFRDACTKSSWPMVQSWLESNTTHSVWDFTNPDEETGTVD